VALRLFSGRRLKPAAYPKLDGKASIDASCKGDKNGDDGNDDQQLD
jgi:hypothetical protein